MVKILEKASNDYFYRFFLKFGKKEHIEAFRNKGQIYMNTLDYFRNLPEEGLIGDRFEGLKFQNI